MGSYSRLSPPKPGDYLSPQPGESYLPDLDGMLDGIPDTLPPTDTVRSVLLSKAVEYEIIPRLILAHRETPACAPSPYAPVTRVQPEDVALFAELVLHEDDAVVQSAVDDMLARGIPVEGIFMDLLGPVAQHLGVLWERDLCDFTAVTMGLGRLQQVLRHNSQGFRQLQEAVPVAPHGRRILLVPNPGEQHTLGLSVVSEFFHRAGWEVDICLLSDQPVSERVHSTWYDVVGFTLGSVGGIARLGITIAQVRRCSVNPHVSIIAGGAVFGLIPGIADQIQADAIVSDGAQAPQVADRLLAERSGKK